MIARVATFEGVNVSEAQRTMDEADAIVRPLVEDLEGFHEYIDLLSSDGKMISIAIFETEEDADAAEDTFDREMPRALGALFDEFEGRRVSVDHYEVLAEAHA
jgi:hypothetical protein